MSTAACKSPTVWANTYCIQAGVTTVFIPDPAIPGAVWNYAYGTDIIGGNCLTPCHGVAEVWWDILCGFQVAPSTPCNITLDATTLGSLNIF